MTDHKQEKRLLLQHDEKDDIETSTQWNHHSHAFIWSFNVRHSIFIWLYFCLLHIAVFATTGLLLSRPNSQQLSRSFTPSSDSITYIEVPQSAPGHQTHSRFSGPPSPDKEAAWEQLILPSFIGLTKVEMLAAGETVKDAVLVSQKDGGGFLGSPAVYHELHCIRRLRMFLYSDYYYGNLTDANMQYLYGHLDHCLEALRVSAMCSADTSLHTFSWGDDPSAGRVHTKTRATRQCIDWDRFQESMSDRAIPFDPELVRVDGVDAKTHL